MNDREFYERFWSSFSSDLSVQLAIHRESRRPLLKMLARHLPLRSPSRFLEVGCGTGLDTCLLSRARPAADAVAVDLAEQAVARARRHAQELGLDVQWMAADLTALPFADEFFDLVFSQGVIEHLSDPGPAVREQVRVLRAGGVLVVDVPQKYNLYTWRKHRAMRENRWDWGWETEYSVGELRGWGQRFGLRVVGATGHQHGRIVDRLLMHPHRLLRRKLRGGHDGMRRYRPGKLARVWENTWDWLDARLGPYLAINVAVAFRKPILD